MQKTHVTKENREGGFIGKIVKEKRMQVAKFYVLLFHTFEGLESINKQDGDQSAE